MLESKSENNGVALLGDNDLRVYSVGVSTAGSAEIKMVSENPQRYVVATTVDKEGYELTNKLIKQSGFNKKVQLKIEDVSQKLPYPDNSFDYIYARLVLHYLDRNSLSKALTELYRILKTNGRIFIVVRSSNCVDALNPVSTKDEGTGMTTYPTKNPKEKFRTRYFHNPKSLHNFIEKAGFRVSSSKVYLERLAGDYKRKVVSDNIDELIEVIGIKI